MEKPILFNTAMVKAILEGNKTVTRRIIKVSNELDFIGFIAYSTDRNEGSAAFGIGSFEDINNSKITDYAKPPYEVGDVLYVRETWCNAEEDLVSNSIFKDNKYLYKVDNNGNIQPGIESDVKRWRPSIHMPKEVSRINLKIISVKVERLQSMKDEDYLKEGIRDVENISSKNDSNEVLKLMFKDIWNSTISKEQSEGLWENNPWVWAIEFEVEK